NNAAAVECYRSLRIRLHTELNAAPDDETSALINSIRGKARSRPDRAARTPAANSPRAACRIPHSVTEMIGREGQLWEIKSLLATTRLLTLTGSGGVGKTRLAIQAASD